MREFGIAAGALYLLDQAFRRISPGLGIYVYEMVVQPVIERALLPAGLSKNLTFREIRRGDPEIESMPALAEIKESRFKQGAMCLGTYQRDKLIGYIWFALNEYQEDEIRCTYVLPDNHPSVFDFDLYVIPEKRMGIGFLGVWDGSNRYLWDQGIRYTFSRLTRFNTATRLAHARLGCKCIGKAVFLKLWGLQLMTSTLSPYVHVSVGRKSSPRLMLKPDALNENRQAKGPRPA